MKKIFTLITIVLCSALLPILSGCLKCTSGAALLTGSDCGDCGPCSANNERNCDPCPLKMCPLRCRQPRKPCREGRVDRLGRCGYDLFGCTSCGSFTPMQCGTCNSFGACSSCGGCKMCGHY